MDKARQEVSPLMITLSTYIAGAVRKAPPREVMARAKIHLVDTVAAMISGSRLLPGTAVLRAIVLGYDICSRLLLSLKPMPFLSSGHHAGAFGQIFGAAATAGALLKLDARRGRRESARIVPILGKQRSHALLAALWDFEKIKDVRALCRLYQK